MWLDIVVIGRNEEKNLYRLKSSIDTISKVVNKIIYVDSASEDDSIIISKELFDIVVEINKEEDLCASLARRTGATYTEKEWILFLDADMEVNEQFHVWLSNFKNKTNNVGFVGKYKDVDEERKKIKYRVFKANNGITMYFGGAVLLKREELLLSGNWSSNIYSNEEIELYSRMRKSNFKVEIIEEIMVNHYTEILSIKEKIRDVISIKNIKNSIGPSQVFVKAIKENYLKYLFYLQPIPYILFIINIITIVLLILYLKSALIWFILSHILLLIIIRSSKRILLGYIFQYFLLTGFLIQLFNKISSNKIGHEHETLTK